MYFHFHITVSAIDSSPLRQSATHKYLEVTTVGTRTITERNQFCQRHLPEKPCDIPCRSNHHEAFEVSLTFALPPARRMPATLDLIGRKHILYEFASLRAVADNEPFEKE